MLNFDNFLRYKYEPSLYNNQFLSSNYRHYLTMGRLFTHQYVYHCYLDLLPTNYPTYLNLKIINTYAFAKINFGSIIENYVLIGPLLCHVKI